MIARYLDIVGTLCIEEEDDGHREIVDIVISIKNKHLTTQHSSAS
jgi:hypothetical protein